MRKNLLYLILVLFACVFFPKQIHAQNTPPPECTTDQVVSVYNDVTSTLSGDIRGKTVSDMQNAFLAAATKIPCKPNEAALSMLAKAVVYAQTSRDYDSINDANSTRTLPQWNGSIDTPTFTPTAPNEVPTPTPCAQNNQTGQTLNTDCGTEGKLCCDSQLSSINPCTDVSTKAQDAFCVDFLFGKICLSSFIDNIRGAVKGLILGDQGGSQEGTGLDSISGLLGTCHDGFVRDIQSDPNDPNNAVCMCKKGDSDAALSLKFCSTYVASAKHVKVEGDLEKDPDVKSCFNCFSDGGYWSALGCIHMQSFQDFIEKNVFGWGLGLAAFIALGCIIYAAVQIQLSQGDAEKLKKARETLTSCILGFMLIIFSVFILRVIGVDILQIPGFSK